MLSVSLILLVASASAGSPQDWRNRTIFQVLTDRFARTDGSTQSCGDISQYCGGTYAGATKKFDYISGMGFDAVWITPIDRQVNDPHSFHGYWSSSKQANPLQLNSRFGSASDLQSFVNTIHASGGYALLDVVANHMGGSIQEISGFSPFNQSSDYHDCNNCPQSCNIEDFTNQPQVQHCRLAGLPDLDQSNPRVSAALLAWVKSAVQTFGFDGIRVDTTPEVNKPFWKQWNAAAGTYAVGEVFNGDVEYVSSYQGSALDGVLSYPLFFTLRNVFAQQQSMNQLQSMDKAYKAFPDRGLLGTFVDNHDNARFLSIQPDQTLYKNALTYVIYSTGIPIIYYGTEQGFNGGNDPNNREPLWTSGYNEQTPLYLFLKTIVGHRKQTQVWEQPQVQRYSDNQFYAFTRGDIFVAMTNVGQHGQQVTRPITYSPYKSGVTLCDLFDSSDCVTTGNNGAFQIQLNNGMPKVLSPQ